MGRRSGEPLAVTIEHALPDRGYAMEVTLTGVPVQGQRADMAVRLTEKGAPIRLAGDNFSRLVHMTLVSADLADHQHEYFFNEDPDGTYPITPPVVGAGPYRLWVEINDVTTSDHHREQADFRAYADFIVAAAAAPTVVPAANESGYQIQFDFEELRAGEPVTIRAQVKNEADEIAKLLQVDSFYSIVGEGASWQLLAHVDRVTDDQTASISTITFPEPGRYSFWTEHYIEAGGTSEIVRDQMLLDVR